MKKLKEEIVQLQNQLKQLQKENDDLKKQLAGGKSPAGKPSLSAAFSAGTELTGDWEFITKKLSGKIMLTITERDGKSFKGTHTVTDKDGNGKLVVDIEGELTGDSFTYKSVGTVKKFTVTGSLKSSSIDCLFTEGADRAKISFKIPK